MSFPCPACGAPVEGRPDRVLITCPSCGARLRSHAVDTDGTEAAFEVQVVGRPQARRRVVIPWDEAQQRRLAAWLVVASIVTVSLVLALFVLARGLRVP